MSTGANERLVPDLENANFDFDLQCWSLVIYLSMLIFPAVTLS